MTEHLAYAEGPFLCNLEVDRPPRCKVRFDFTITEQCQLDMLCDEQCPLKLGQPFIWASCLDDRLARALTCEINTWGPARLQLPLGGL